MKTRVVAGLFAAAALVTLILKGPQALITSTVLVLAVLAYLEYDHLLFQTPSRTRQIRQMAFIFLVILAIRQSPSAGWVMFWICTISNIVYRVIDAGKGGDFSIALQDLAIELLGLWYLVALFGFLAPIAGMTDHGREYLLLLFLMVFAGDTAAYFAGRLMGKHTLAEHISPKKTVEGSVAAVAASLLAAYLWIRYFHNDGRQSFFELKILAVAPIVSGLAQLGDLFESFLKRSRFQKDSGTFLPGHGGLLDRIDGLALSAPVYYFYLVHVLERQ